MFAAGIPVAISDISGFREEVTREPPMVQHAHRAGLCPNGGTGMCGKITASADPVLR